MRVICIDNKHPERPDLITEKDWIFEGEIYTVSNSMQFPGGLYYILAERSNLDRPVYYNSRRFLPLMEQEDIVESKTLEMQF